MAFTAGQKLRASDMESLPRIVARHRRTTTTSAITASSEATAVAVLRLQASVKSGHRYQVGCPQAAGYAEVSASRSQWAIFYTENGSNPTTSSTRLTQSGAKHADLGFVDFFPCFGFYTPSSDLTFTAQLFVWRPTGTGNIFAYGAGPDLEFVIIDMGTDPGSTGTTL